jgi:DNA-3-methyladenine glycosylase II
MDKIILHLKKDPILAKIIKDELPPESYSYQENDLLTHIIIAICNQQLSGKAASTIYNRLLDLLPDRRIDANEILNLSDEAIRKAGLSRPKIKYIKGICQAISLEQLDLAKIPSLSDEEVVNELVKLPGIGRWTAEMIMIFNLNRPDVFSVGDLGLRTAVASLYHVDREDLKKIEEISSRWRPYRSTASKILWRSLDG